MSVAKFLLPLHIFGGCAEISLPHATKYGEASARLLGVSEARQEWERGFLPSTFVILHCTDYVLFVIRSF